MRLAPLLGLLLLLGILAPAHAEDADLPAQEQALAKEAAIALEALADWCTKKKLYGKRDEVYERLLTFDPEHKKARKKLRYDKTPDQGWVQHPRYKRPRNLAKKGQAEADEKLAAIMDAHVGKQVALAKKAASIADLLWARSLLAGLHSTWPGRDDIAPAERDVALRYHAATREKGLLKEMLETEGWLRERYGTDLLVRDALGEVEREGLWLLAESARTLDAVAGLDAVLAEARKATPKESEPTKTEAKIELPWSQAVATKHVRVAGTAKAEHLAKVAVACEAAGALFAKALGTKPAWRADLTIYLFAKKGERETFLAGFPVVDNPTIKHQDKLDLVYADGQALAVRNLLARGQLDLAVNEVLNMMVSDTFLGHETPLAWHAEGISRYLAWKLTNTRMAIAVSNKYAGDKQDRAVPDADSPWLPHVRKRLEAKPAGLQLLLGKGTDAFSARDALVSYGFAIYLIEGYDGLAGSFVKEHWTSKDVDRACRDLLATPRVVVEHRMKRWLDEVMAHSESRR